MVRQTKSALATQKLASEILLKLSGRNVICLYGQMGAGKTTLVQGIARELGIESRVISPTFVLARRYEINSNFKFQISNFKLLWHVDLYRLEDMSQIESLGLSEMWADSTNLVIIEWPEKLVNLLPKNKLEVKLSHVMDDVRLVEIGI